MLGTAKRRVALGLVVLASLGPAAASDALPSAGSIAYSTRVEYTDNTATLTWNENGLNGAASSFVPKPGDPLTFLVYAGPPAPGTNTAFVRIELFNNTGGDVRFPGGLNVPVILRNGARTQVALVRHPATSLAPGTGLHAETTSPLRGFGQYSASAFTVARFASP
jgi:hypothetical protein